MGTDTTLLTVGTTAEMLVTGATTEEPLTALGMVVTGTAVGGVLGLLGSDVLCRLLVDVGLRL